MSLRTIVPRALAWVVTAACLSACPTPPSEPPPAAGSTPEAAAVQAGSGASSAATPAPAAAPAPPGSGAPAALSCSLVPHPDGSGAVTCSEGCVLIKGAPVAADAGCALVGQQYEVAMGCVAFPLDVVEAGACWVNDAGVHVLTAFTFLGLLQAGWSFCPDDYPLRSAAPCGAAAQPPVAPAPPTGLQLGADGTVLRDGSGHTP